MIWILGTGKCGTHSAAREYNGLHEPRPWPLQANRACHGDEDAIQSCREAVAGRLALGVPAIADMHSSYIVPIIRELDPAPSFVWLIRHPVPTVASWLRTTAWEPGRGPHNYATMWEPAHGWPEAFGRLEKATLYVAAVLRMLLSEYEPDWKVTRCDSLREHEGRAYDRPPYVLSEDERAYIETVCGAVWERVEGLA